MARARFTVTDLRARIETINGWLEKDGSAIRFRVQGRNGYQAVDEYGVDGGCNRNVGCGTSRECAEYAETAYSNEYRTLISRENEKLRAENAELKGQVG